MAERPVAVGTEATVVVSTRELSRRTLVGRGSVGINSHPQLTFALILAGAYLALFLGTSWRIGDEGSILYGAQRVTEGEVPYRDFFEVMGPGTFYWYALWFKALGTSWLTSRIAILVTALASGWALYFIASRRCSGPLAFVPAGIYTLLAVPLWPGANHHLDSNMWVLLAVATVVSAPAVDRQRGVAAGVFAGIASTMMPHKGVLVIAALTMWAVFRGERPLGEWRRGVSAAFWMLLGFASIGFLVLAMFWYQSALPDLLYANLTWPATQYHSVNSMPYAYGIREWHLPHWSSVLRMLLPLRVAPIVSATTIVPLIFVAALPLIAAVLMVRHLWRERDSTSEPSDWLRLYGFTALALFVSECHRPDVLHLIYGSPLLLVLVTTLSARVSLPVAGLVRRTLVACCATLAALLAIIGSLPDTEVATRRGTVHKLENDEALKFLQEHVAPGEHVFVYPYYPMYYFLADVRNPTRYSILMYNINTRDQFSEVIDSLESQQVEYVLWDTLVAGENFRRWFPAYRHPPRDELIVETYLQQHYRVLMVKNGFRILQRVDRPLDDAPGKVAMTAVNGGSLGIEAAKRNELRGDF